MSDSQEDRQAKLLADYESVFKSPSGERVLHDLVVNRMISTPVIGSHEAMAYNEGQRSVVLTILDMAGFQLAIEHKPQGDTR